MVTVEIRKAINAPDVADQASQFISEKLESLLRKNSVVHFCLTGGSVGILTLKMLGQNEHLRNLELNRVHFWFGDERYVAGDSSDRNAIQARDALFSQLNIAATNIHEFPSADSGLDVLEAAKLFELELNQVFGSKQPAMDLMILGMGPDGHVASIFPGHQHQGALIVAEQNSPKPPALRLSMSMELINRSNEIVFVVSGIDKAQAIEQVHQNENCDLPAAQVIAKNQTIWFIDEAAGAAFWSC